MRDLNVTIVQTKLFWEDINANLGHFDTVINKISIDTDLIILPEMFTTGFTMNAEKLAQTMDGESVSWMKQISGKKKTDITGSLIIKEDKKFFNRLVWVKPTGELFFYDKKHLFRFSSEEKTFTPGSKRIIVNLKGWKICPFVCYDLRFPLWTRNYHKTYDIAIFVANWPEMRSLHWKTLLAARAIENQAYTIGVNRVGRDGNNLDYSGDSSIIDPKGNIIFQKSSVSCVHTETIPFNPLQEYRDKFPAWMDADDFIIP